MVDGRPWVASKDNPTKLLIESARKLYGTSNEELMDNAKQFAYYPVAVLQERRQLLERHDQREVQDRRRRRRSRVGHPLQREAERRLAGASATTTPRTTSRCGSSTTASAAPMQVQRSRRSKFMLDRAAWHELKLDGRRRELQGLARRRDGARVHARQRARPRPQRRAAAIRICFPRTTRSCGRRSAEGRPVGEDRQHQLLQGLRRQPEVGAHAARRS